MCTCFTSSFNHQHRMQRMDPRNKSRQADPIKEAHLTPISVYFGTYRCISSKVNISDHGIVFKYVLVPHDQYKVRTRIKFEHIKSISLSHQSLKFYVIMELDMDGIAQVQKALNLSDRYSLCRYTGEIEGQLLCIF